MDQRDQLDALGGDASLLIRSVLESASAGKALGYGRCKAGRFQFGSGGPEDGLRAAENSKELASFPRPETWRHSQR
ncbi:MAG: hypothetical protein ABL995_03185 [Bryobacteraceae bacterium]